MKKILLYITALTLTGSLFAQNAPRARVQQAVPPPLPLREVSGIVKDTLDNTIIGATLTLVSRHDTLRTATNVNGIFIFKNVKMATFVLTVKEIGFLPTTRKFLLNDAVKRLVLDPIILKSETKMMNEVKINGTPSIVYKVDTIEYKASDYKVRDNATVDELLKKMEGFEVGSDGSVTHQGQQIAKARLNGKDYAGGDVAQAIQNLPADIVEKIQVVDDYGDQAARTGIKDGDPQKVLNITTRADRSVGTTGRFIGQYGNNDRYNGQLFAQRINANEQIGFIGRVANTVNGVVSTGVAGGATNGGGGGTGVGAGAGRGSSSPGTTKSASPTINFRDQWGKKVQVVASYSFRYNDNNSTNISNGYNRTVYGPTTTVGDSTLSENLNKTHNLNFEMDYSIDSANYLQITPSYSYSSATSGSTSITNNVNDFTLVVPGLPPPPGFSHPLTHNITNNLNSAPSYGGIIFYQHIFKKPRRNASIQLSVNNSTTQANSDKNDGTHYYIDSTLESKHLDSLSHTSTIRTSENTTYRTSVTYVEPLNILSQLEFNGQIRHSIYNNVAVTDTILANGQTNELFAKDNSYNYTFTETRATLNYRFNGSKYNYSLGATLIPTSLSGVKVNISNTTNAPVVRNDFKVIPVFRFSYSWSRTQRFTIAYSGTNAEPSFQQIQPFTDVSDPNHIIVGNPDLKPAFTNSINVAYNNYIANSKLNLSFNGNASITDDQIESNNILIPERIIKNGQSVNRTVTETSYLNLNGAHAYVGRYNIAKQLDDRKYNLSLNGNITYGYGVGLSQGQEFHSTQWRFDERFGPRITPSDNFEINPYIGYDLSRNFNSIPPNPNGTVQTNPQVQTTSLAVDGRMFFFTTWQVNYSASKSYVTGLGNLSTNPLVINAGFEKEFFKKKNLVITFNAYDLLHQNNFLQQTITNTGYTNTQSNSLSRYFLVGVRVILQKWSGTPTRNGRQMQRRGDGSFIY